MTENKTANANLNTNLEVTRQSKIEIQVDLNAAQMPVNIAWTATDMPNGGLKNCKAMSLAFFDVAEKDTLRMDLWTTDLQVDEMNKFVFQMLYTLANTYQNATGEANAAKDIRDFAEQFGLKQKVIKQGA